MAETYAGYLRLGGVLTLQHPTTPAEDDPSVHAGEHFFIVLHQAFELWFKQVLVDLDCATVALAGDAGAGAALDHLRRVAAVLTMLRRQMSLLDHLSPQGFLAFRDNLGTTSGAESAQHREIKDRLGLGPSGVSAVHRAVMDRIAADVARPGITADAPDARLLTDLLKALADISEGWHQLWSEHRRSVGRFIGNRTGSGGTSGAEHLASAAARRAFPDLVRVAGREAAVVRR
ncbi:MAG: tryptophan 2,3-dioxygenase family protein [Acidimicrobiales bacterium]